MSPLHRAVRFAADGGYRAALRTLVIVLGAVGAGLIASLLTGS